MMPTAETLAIAFGSKTPRSRIWRPELGHCFSVWIDPVFTPSEAAIVRAAMVAMTGLTGGNVGFEVGARVHDDVRIVKDGARNYPPYCGLTYPHVTGAFIVDGAEIVIHPDWVRPKVVRHELGHVLGMCDCELPGSVMGGLDIDSTTITDLDREAWLYMASLPTGTFRPGHVPSGVGSAVYYSARALVPVVIVDAQP